MLLPIRDGASPQQLAAIAVPGSSSEAETVSFGGEVSSSDVKMVHLGDWQAQFIPHNPEADAKVGRRAVRVAFFESVVPAGWPKTEATIDKDR